MLSFPVPWHSGMRWDAMGCDGHLLAILDMCGTCGVIYLHYDVVEAHCYVVDIGQTDHVSAHDQFARYLHY